MTSHQRIGNVLTNGVQFVAKTSVTAKPSWFLVREVSQRFHAAGTVATVFLVAGDLVTTVCAILQTRVAWFRLMDTVINMRRDHEP